MITFILKLLILVYLFYMIKYVYEMLQYNTKASLLTLDITNKDKIDVEMKNKSPLVMDYMTHDLTLETMNYRIPGYIINDGYIVLFISYNVIIS